MTDFAQWQDAATPERQQGRVCFDREARAALHAAYARLSSLEGAKALLDRPDEMDEVEATIERLDPQVEDATKTLTFERIPRGRWREIEDQHPATDEQRKANQRQTINAATFEPAIVAECNVDPGMTVEQAQWLYDFLPDDEWEREVLSPVYVANKVGGEAPKDARDIALTMISELRSISRANEESRSPSSGDES